MSYSIWNGTVIRQYAGRKIEIGELKNKEIQWGNNWVESPINDDADS